ncbi:MAG: 2-oxo acid dehydrogenase subunit E2 [Deltaproteobacteria bacterium]|nr:2-oxo acid dehydrogenase subunit E2 [Deltaproteobacteria bacterium]
MSRYADRVAGSAMRRLLLNLYEAPSGDPTVGGMAELDATELLAFLERANRRSAVKLTPTHVFVKILADSLRRYPELNVKVIGRRIYRLRNVDIRVAVNLFPQGDDSPEVSLVLVPDADQKSLTEIAHLCGERAQWSRQMGGGGNLAGALLRLARYVPDIIFDPAVRLGLRVATSGQLARWGIARDPMGSACLTNVGSFGLPPGAIVSGAMGLLPRFGYASLVMTTAIQQRAVVVDGEVKVRPMLPVALAVDHRALDGFRVFRYFRYWADMIAQPEQHLGGCL